MLIFVENNGGGGAGQDPKKNRLLIHISNVDG